MTGLFAELGPCGIDHVGEVYNNPYSWTNVSNVLFVDQPSQVGFSYSQPVPAYAENGQTITLPDDQCPDDISDTSSCGTYSSPDTEITANSTLRAASAFWNTLQGFTGVFPQYSQNGIHIATESYGGHYGPVFGTYIERQNGLNIPGTKKIDLKTLLVGNGWFDPVVQFQAFYNFTITPGNTYDYVPFNDTIEAMLFDNLYGAGMCLDQLRDCKSSGSDTICAKADRFCQENVEDVYHDVLGRDVYDVRELDSDPFPYKYYVEYLNTPKVQQAIGAFTNFSVFSSAVNEAFSTTGDDAREVDTIDDIRYLLERNITVALYAGDADFDCNWIGGEVIAKAVGAPGFGNAGYTNLTTSDSVVHAQVKQAGRFSFTRIYESGHMVPFYQPLTALELFDRAINGLDIETGLQTVGDVYITGGTRNSLYREGAGTMQWEASASNSTYNVVANKPGQLWRPAGNPKESTISNYLQQYFLDTNTSGEGGSIWRLIVQCLIYLFLPEGTQYIQL